MMQGHRLRLSSFSISFNDDGDITSDGPKLSLGVEMAPYWLAIASGHAVDAERLSEETNEAWRGDDPEQQRAALNAEFSSSLQAITAAVFAIDAFYATVQEASPVPEATLAAWKRNRTSRSRRVFETFRRNFPLAPASQAALKTFLDQIFSFRDAAVHPTARTRDARKHPRLPVSVDETFCKFRARNAWFCVGQVMDLLDLYASHPKVRSPELRERLEPLQKLFEAIVQQWRTTPAGAQHRRLQPAPNKKGKEASKADEAQASAEP